MIAEVLLRWNGDWSWSWAMGAAVAAAACAFLLYRKDTRCGWILASLRSAAIFMIVLMLGGPVLHHRETIGDLARVIVCVDSSDSMQLTDASMSAERKKAIVEKMDGIAGEKAAVEKLDATRRWERVQSLLLGSNRGILSELAKKHDVLLVLLQDGDVREIWRAGGASGAVPATLPPPTGEHTDLASALKVSGGAKSAMVLFSDGQQNSGESPIEAAKQLGARKIPVFTVGM